MTRDEVKDLIVQVVTDIQGAKTVELVADERLTAFVSFELLEELVAEGRLVEVEYVLPERDWQCKSFYLPKGTDVRVKNAN
jgi:hypothetical protein